MWTHARGFEPDQIRDEALARIKLKEFSQATVCIDRAIPVTHGRDYYYLRAELRQHNGFGTDHLRDAVDLYKQTWQDLQIADDLEPDEFLRKHRDGPAVLGSVGLWPSRSWALKAYTKIVASDDIRLALRAARVLGQLGRAATPALDALELAEVKWGLCVMATINENSPLQSSKSALPRNPNHPATRASLPSRVTSKAVSTDVPAQRARGQS